MSKYNDTTYAILGILTTSCRSGYEIKQFIDQSLAHFWKISYGQIYPTLKLITEDGLATLETYQQASKPNRHEYLLTNKGFEILREWLELPLKQTPVERNEVLLKLFFGSHQSKQQNIELLLDYKTRLEARYDIYVSIENSIKDHSPNDPDAKYWILTLDYGKRTTSAAIDWCLAAIEQCIEEEEE